jgi:hypothetical protein
MGKWKRLRDEYTERDKQAKSAGIKAGARGSYFDENDRLVLAPMDELYDEDGRYRGPKGRR